MKTTIPYDAMSTTSRSEPLFSKCCCIPLRLGCFILGYINVAFTVIRTLSLFAITAIIGVTTHGFDHFDNEARTTEEATTIEAMERPLLAHIGILLVIILIGNIAWMIINLACLIGLHMKRPGPIRVYVGFATFRLVLSLVGFVYLATTADLSARTVAAHCLELGLNSYFILVYYVYAMQLERELAQEAAAELETQEPMKNMAFIIPTNLDKQVLVA